MHPMYRTVHLSASDNGTFVGDVPGSTRPTHIEIVDVPDNIPSHEVRRRLHGLIIWPWPTQPVPWGKIAGLPPGRIVRDLV